MVVQSAATVHQIRDGFGLGLASVFVTSHGGFSDVSTAQQNICYVHTYMMALRASNLPAGPFRLFNHRHLTS